MVFGYVDIPEGIIIYEAQKYIAILKKNVIFLVMVSNVLNTNSKGLDLNYKNILQEVCHHLRHSL